MRATSGPELRFALLALPLTLGLAGPATAQARRAFSAADYDRAVRMLGPTVNPLAVGGTAPGLTWLPDGRFHYRSVRPAGTEYVLVDPRRKSRAPLFDHARMASALRSAAGVTASGRQPPVAHRLEPHRRGAQRRRAKRHGWLQRPPLQLRRGRNRLQRNRRIGQRARRTGRGSTAVSPDASAPPSSATGTSGCATWPPARKCSSRPTASRTSATPPTTPAGPAAIAPSSAWSPDSKKIATQQQDERKVGDMYLVQTRVGHPVLRAWKYPLPGRQRGRDGAPRRDRCGEPHRHAPQDGA